MHHNLKYLLLLLAVFFQLTSACAQEKADTAAMIKELGRVMAFASQPYVYYTTSSTMVSVPVLNPEDTLSTQGVFYKYGSDMYYCNGPEEIYLQDSLLVQVNTERKSIWVSRVDMASKEKLNHLSMGNRQLQEMLRKKYTIQQVKPSAQTAGFHFETRQLAGQSTYITSMVNIAYSTVDHLPKTMQTEIRLQQPANDALVQQIKDGGIDENSLLRQIGDKKYIVRTQQVNTVFAGFDNTEQKAKQLPLWQSILLFNASDQSFSGTGIYAGYEVTKTF